MDPSDETSTRLSLSPSQRAFSEAVRALSRDMPILMHGSGDVLPDQVNPDTVQLMCELTVQYMSNLVDAAVDAQQLLAGSQATVPPPPPYPKKRKPPLPSAPEPPKKDGDEKNKITEPLLEKKPIRPDVEYWDEPLPEPKIVKRPRTSLDPRERDVRASAFHSPRAHQQSAFAKEAGKEQREDQQVHIDEWVGVAGVDFWEQSRSRAAHVRMPFAIGVQCFIFPICHDGYLYGKAMQVQASRRAIAPILTDQVLMDYVRTEGGLVRKHAPRRKKNEKKKTNGDAGVEDEPEDDVEEEDEDESAQWPGLESLLPVHRIKPITEN